MHSALIYDLEIVRAIPNGASIPAGIECCKGWHDHANMAISVVGAYDYSTNRSRIFLEDNIEDFFSLCANRALLIGFNNINFDNRVLHYAKPHCAAVPPIFDEKCYDILLEMWAAAGLGPDFVGQSHEGYGLDETCRKNGLGGKAGHGALAPILWQQGARGKVIDYCLNDVFLEKSLFDLVLSGQPVISAKDGSPLSVRRP